MTSKFEFNRKYHPLGYNTIDIYGFLVNKYFKKDDVNKKKFLIENNLYLEATEMLFLDFERVKIYETEYKRISKLNAEKHAVKQTRQPKTGKEARKIYLELCKKFPNQVFSDIFNDPNSPFPEERIRMISWPNGSFQLTEKEFSK